MLARDAMTISPAVVTTNDPIARAAELMRDWDTGIIPVVTSLATTLSEISQPAAVHA